MEPRGTDVGEDPGMLARRHAAQLVFATAALASIATSMAPPWELYATAEIEPTIAGSGPALGFGITAEARGPAAAHQGGDVNASLQIELDTTLGDAELSTVKVVLESETDPTLRDEQMVTVSLGAPSTTFLVVPAWVQCEAGPCFDDFKLTISEVTPGTHVSVSGTINVILRGRDPSPEPDHEALVTVTPLGAL
jgi:hypothetical protein